MRIIVLLGLLFPVFVKAQINRSANEFARETVEKYITTKLFKGQPYKAVSFDELKPREERNKEINWSIAHKFLVAETIPGTDKTVQHPYAFTFYLDKRMKVLRADAFYLN